MATKKTSVEWMQTHPYPGNVFIDSPDGWATEVTDKDGKKKIIRDLYQSFNVEQITEEEFRDRLKRSNAPVPQQTAEEFAKAAK